MKKVNLYCEVCGAGKAKFILSDYDEAHTIPVVLFTKEIGMTKARSMHLCKKCLKRGLELLEEE